ncbi:hypothetical protein [Pyruvatibacter mobilis]|uniref:hypothetical protein n=1 Tax=Pyruvatibacter mobilis TaxID=1712261 RepID=UPI003BAD332C
MRLSTPQWLNAETWHLPLPTDEQLQERSCGVHRGSIEDVDAEFPELVPHILEAIASYRLDDYEYDVKVHMLFKGMYPCIPNWHCDNVPRPGGSLDYSAINRSTPPMLLWVSGAPTTRFLFHEEALAHYPVSHGHLDEIIRLGDFPSFSIKPKSWYAMWQDTPHRGTAATESGWRIFIRATPKEIASERHVVSKTRRHSQVYLPHDFHW